MLLKIRGTIGIGVASAITDCQVSWFNRAIIITKELILPEIEKQITVGVHIPSETLFTIKHHTLKTGAGTVRYRDGAIRS